MTQTTLLPGVEQRGDGFRVRVRFGGRQGFTYRETLATAAAANRRVLELQELREAGLAPEQAPRELTLCEAAEQLLTRKRTTVSRKTKRPLRPRGLEWWDRVLRPWREDEFSQLPLSMLSRPRVEDAILRRAVEHPKTAGDELYGLKAALRYAGERGARFDQALLTIEAVTVEHRARVALTAAELELLAKHAPGYARRFLLFKGTVGNRINELFTLTDDRVDIDEGWIYIPAQRCKEGVDKYIDLTSEETQLLREQLSPLRDATASPTASLPGRAAGTDLVFPTKTGQPWRHYQFLRLVWYKARDRAATAWRAERDLAADAATPFDGLQPHDLRATAATLMRDAGFTREEAAGRLGHADSGQLLDRIYDRGDRRARTRNAIAAHAPAGLRAVLAEPAGRRSQTPAAAADSVTREGR